jgi:hypothetical protein
MNMAITFDDFVESKYMRKEDIHAPVLLTAAAVERVELNVPGKPIEIKPLMHFKERGYKPLLVNKTNWFECAEIFGTRNLAEWLGKQLVIYIDPNVSYAGKRIGGIRVRAPAAVKAKTTLKQAEPIVEEGEDDLQHI